MSYDIKMYYGDYEFSPVPMVTLNKTYDRTNDQTAISSTFSLELNGSLYSASGITDILNKQTSLRSGFNEDGRYFQILCDEDVIFECYPRIIGNLVFNPTNNNWTQTASYNISLEFDNEPVDVGIVGSGENISTTGNAVLMPPFIKSADENWSLEPVSDIRRYNLTTSGGADKNPYQFRLTHNLSAVGKRHYQEGGLRMEAWQEASGWVVPRLGYDATQVSGGVFNIDITNLGPYNHARTQQKNELDGTFSVTESWLILDLNSTGFVSGAVTEDYSVNYDSSLENAHDVISIEGTIRGLEDINYDGTYSITNTAYEHASGYWNSIKDTTAIYPRAQAIADLHDLTLNIVPLTKVVGHSLSNGAISYTYTYNDRPSHCITGNGFTVRSENIQISDNNVVDIFTQVIVPGRARGPILMDISTVTQPTREVSIELIVNKHTGCVTDFTPTSINTEVNSLLCQIETDLSGSYDQVFKHQDTMSWVPNLGRYSRNVGWTMGICDKDALTTSFC